MADKKSVLTKKETSAKSAAAAVAAKKTEAAPVAPTKVESPAAPAKKTAKKTTTRKSTKKTAVKKNVERVQEVYFEFDEKQIEAGQVVKKIEEAYKNEGHQIGRIKDLKVYINPSDNRAYYVINGNAEGKSVEL